MEQVEMVNGSFATDTNDGGTIIVKMNQRLNFTDYMENSLMCVNQARYNAVVVNDVHKEYNPTSTFDLYLQIEDTSIP